MKTIRTWINKIQDKTVKKKLLRNTPPSDLKRKEGTMHDAICSGFIWRESPEGYKFWEAIYKHFYIGTGKKSYKDFKHLDKSIK